MTNQEFEYIACKIRPGMMKLAAAFFQNREDAEDAVQEVLVKMWLRPWLPGDNVEGMATKAIKNQCISIRRKQFVRQTVELDNEARGTAGTDDSDVPIRIKEQKEIIEQAINKLQRSEQRLIRMTQRGLEAEEIALITDIPVRSVRTILSTARKKLIKQIQS